MSKGKKPLGPRTDHMKRVLSLFGGLHGLSAICEVSVSAISQWKTRVPMNHHRALVEYAKANSIEFTAENLLEYDHKPAGKLCRNGTSRDVKRAVKEHRVMSQ